MKVGDLVKLKEAVYSAGFHKSFHDAQMLVIHVQTHFLNMEIPSVVEVMGPVGLARFSNADLEVICESR